MTPTGRHAVQPPEDNEAEQAVLGAMMIERAAALTAAATLEPEDFHGDAHRCLFRVMVELAERGPFDHITVQSALREQGHLDAVGGEGYLIELSEAALTAAMARSYAETVRRVAVRRRRWLAALEFSQKPSDPDAEGALIAACAANVYGSGLDLTVYEADTLLQDPPPRPDAIVERVCLAQTVNILAGPPGSAKSWAAQAVCLGVTAGRRFLGRFQCLRGPALLVDEESALPMLAERLALLNSADPRPPDAEPFLILPMQGLHFDDPACQSALLAEVRKLRPRLLVVDTVAATAGGIDLINVTQVRAWTAFFRRLAQQCDLAAVLLAHGPKWQGKVPDLKNVFGSVDWGANADAVHALCDVGTNLFRFVTVKDRWSPKSDALDLTFSLVPGPSGGLVLASDAVAQGVAHLILSRTDDDWTPQNEIKDYVVEQGFTDRAVRAGFRKLVADGILEERPDPMNHRWREFRRTREAS